MKKIISLVLAVLMMLSLCACGASEAQLDEILATVQEMQATLDALTAEEAPAEEAPAEEAPAEKIVVDFEWNGQKEVWSVLPTTGAEGLVWINDAMGAAMESQGFTYVKKDAMGDPAAQVQFIEDAIAAGNVGAIMCAAMSVELLQDVVIEALEAGIAVAYLGAEPTAYGISGCVYTAYEITGMYAVQAAEDWVAKRVAEGGNVPANADGKYEIAVDTYYDIADGVYRSQAMVGTIEKSETLTLVAETTSYGQNAYTDAFNNAQDVLGANPDCHIFIAYEPEEAMGAADAIANHCEVNGLDLADYCVIPCYGEDTTFTEMYNEALADPSANAIKGYATYGDVLPYGDETAALMGPSYDSFAAYSQELQPEAPIIIPPLVTGAHLADILLSACGIEGYDFALENILSEYGYGDTYYDTITVTNVYGYADSWSMGDENPAIEYKTN